MPSVVGLLEERELGARVRTEALREEADRVLAALAESETEWQEWVIARQRVGVVLREGPATATVPEVVPSGGAVEAAPAVAVVAVPQSAPVPAAPAVSEAVSPAVAPVGAVRTVAVWAPGLGPVVLRESYRTVVEVLASAARSGGQAATRSCPEIAVALGMELTKNNVEGRVRHVAKRLVDRGWLVEPVRGRFRIADGPAAGS
ncbi:MAG: hypothetical protein QOG57_5289 [Pseudonocardiales bacterium]|jgi:hypothetical protein|nr:hypothetical protein [Pseudonocardiales bacterium]